MKDFVEIQYCLVEIVFWSELFWLVEIITGIKGKHFSKKELIFCLIETVFFGQCYLAASRNQPFWQKCIIHASGQLVSRLLFCPLFGDPSQFFFRLVKSISQENPYFGLVETDFRANNGFHKTEILIPQAKMKDSLERYVSTTRKSCLHRREYLKKIVKNGFK